MKTYFRVTKQSQKIVSIISARQTGEKIFLLLLSQLKKTTKKSPYTFLERALFKLEPGVKLEPKVRRGKTTYIPKYLRWPKGYRIALNWLLDGAKDHTRKITFINRLTNEVLTTLEDKSVALNLRDDFLDFVQECFVSMKRRFKRYFSMKRYRRKKKQLLSRVYKLIVHRKKNKKWTGIRRKKKKKWTNIRGKKIKKFNVIRILKTFVKRRQKKARRLKAKLYRKTGKEKYKFKFIKYKPWYQELSAELTPSQKLKKKKKFFQKQYKDINKYVWNNITLFAWDRINKRTNNERKKINKLITLVLNRNLPRWKKIRKIKKIQNKYLWNKKNTLYLKKIQNKYLWNKKNTLYLKKTNRKTPKKNLNLKIKRKIKAETKKKIRKTIDFIVKTKIALWWNNLSKEDLKKPKKKKLNKKKLKKPKKKKLNKKKLKKPSKKFNLNNKSIVKPQTNKNVYKNITFTKPNPNIEPTLNKYFGNNRHNNPNIKPTLNKYFGNNRHNNANNTNPKNNYNKPWYKNRVVEEPKKKKKETKKEKQKRIKKVKKLIKEMLKRKILIWEKVREILKKRRKKQFKSLLYKVKEKNKKLLLYKLKEIQLKNNNLTLSLIKNHTEYNKLIVFEKKIKTQQKKLETKHQYLKKIALNELIKLKKNVVNKYVSCINVIKLISLKNITERKEFTIVRKYIQMKQKKNRYNYNKNKLNYNKNLLTYLDIIDNIQR